MPVHSLMSLSGTMLYDNEYYQCVQPAGAIRELLQDDHFFAMEKRISRVCARLHKKQEVRNLRKVLNMLIHSRFPLDMYTAL